MHMSNYKFTVGYLMEWLHEQVATGLDPDTPVWAHNEYGELTELASIEPPPPELTNYPVVLSLPYLPDPTDRDFANDIAQAIATMVEDKQVEGKRKNNKYDWRRVDWSRSTGYLAKKLGVDATQVSRARRKYAPRTVRPVRKKA